ncbi:protein snail homolog Sna-like [Leucoraja erinacea]|uniref:protein snail homolog Sna-like n=2 Tax=Rajidae TaxID=30475 RepID=UPI0024590A34|nr:protein snail homolog Sna-like [Leucoraja erinacea]
MGFDRSICAVGSRGLQLCINHLLEPTSPSSSLASLGATRRLEEGGTNATPPPPTAGPAPNIYTRTRTPSTSYLGALTLGGRGGLSQTRSLLSLDLGAYRQTGNLKMPRSFLIKKHFSTSKKPNYGELDSQTVIISPFLYEKYPVPAIPQPDILSSAAYYPAIVWDAGLISSFCSADIEANLAGKQIDSQSADSAKRCKPHDLASLSSEEEDGKTSDPPSPDSSATEAEKFQCNQCTKSYSTFAGLSRHKQLHCEVQARKSFNCKYCEKEYVSLGALKMHIRSHTLPCVCKICGKAFSRPWLLQGHIRTHTGEKPFSCPHCNRAFADRSNLRAHLQTHSDVKKYQCKNCSKTFSRMSLLHKHEETGCCAAR